MFYGALDPVTAAAEVYRPQGKAAVATFRTLRDLDVVDLAGFPGVSQFDDATDPRLVYLARFVSGFTQEISKPILHDDRIHREYVPTQVVIEYLRYQLLPDGTGIDGVLYPSAVTGETNLVLFVTQSGCLSDSEIPEDSSREEPQVLEGESGSYRVYEFLPPQPRECGRGP